MNELTGAPGRSTSEVFPLDDVDRAIVTELQVDGDVKISGFEMTETFGESVRSVLLPTNKGMKGAIL